MDYIISITNNCNLSCRYCYEKRLNTERGCLSSVTSDNIINFINNRNDADLVYLFGGEPLLYKDMIKKLAENIKAKEFIITTNGTLLEEGFIDWCMHNHVRINMSHDGMDCSDRGADVSILNEKLKLLVKYQPGTLVQLVYSEKNLNKLYENVLFFKKLGVKKVSAAMDAYLIPHDADAFAEEMRIQWEKTAGIPDMYIHELADMENSIQKKDNKLCEICKKKMFINWNGKIYPCVQFQNMPEFYCGDVVNGLLTLPVRIRHPDYSVRAVRCDGCEIAQYCKNSCACRKMSTTGSLTDISEASCIEQQVLILTVLSKITNNK